MLIDKVEASSMKLCLIFSLFFLMAHIALAEQCGEGRHWVRAHHRRAYYRSTGIFVKAAEVTAHCQDNQQSFKTWRDKLLSGVPKGWSHHTEKPTSWTDEEIERLLEALDDIPKELLANSIKGIYRFAKSDAYPNQGTWGPNVIALYDTAFDQNNNLTRVLAHELSHEVYADFSDPIKDSYRLATDWYRLKAGNGHADAPRWFGFVEEDGKISPTEDFANNVEYYLFEPKKLMDITPTAYRWIEKHFGDKFKMRGNRDEK
jgi:hypothetical protein